MLHVWHEDKVEPRKGIYKLPLAMTRAGTPVAAMAEHMAYLFWATLTFLCHLLQVLVGANM